MGGRCLILVSVLFLAFVLPVLSLDKCTQDKLTYEFTECDSSQGRWRVAVPKDPDSCEASEVPVRQKDCSKYGLLRLGGCIIEHFLLESESMSGRVSLFIGFITANNFTRLVSRE